MGERHFVILTDNASFKFFETQPNLSTQQARWQAFLAQFHYELKYRKGRDNIIADALSRRIYLITMNFVTNTFLQDIKDFYPMNPSFGAKQIQFLDSTQSKTSPYTLQDGILFYKDKVCILNHGNFRMLLLCEYHSSPMGGHFRVAKCYALLKRSYFWPEMLKGVKIFIKSYL